MTAAIFNKHKVKDIYNRAKQHAESEIYACSINLDTVSPAVERVEATLDHINSFDKMCIFFGVFLISYAYGMDSILRYSFQPIAVSDLGDHSLLATVTVVRAVIGAVAQPTAAKVADVFGRLELIVLTIGFYVIGTAIEASSTSVAAFATGSIFYQIGYTSILLLVEVVIADVTSLRARLVFSYIPALPFLINAWIGGEVLEAVLKVANWRWGIGMWGIIYPVCGLPLVTSLWWVNYKAKRAGDLRRFKTPFQKYGGCSLIKALFWQLDIVGIILLICIFGFILVPFTIAGGIAASWAQTKIIAPLVTGIILIPIWVLWEWASPYPMVPFKLLKDRAVWGALGIAFFLMFAWGCQGDFLFSVIRVAFDESEKSASRITALYSFCATLTGVTIGMLVYRVRRLKPFIMVGTLLFMVAFGLLIYYRGGPEGHSGIIGAQILLGISGGFFPYAAQASIQAATEHEHTAIVTGLYLATYNLGSALGNTVSGIIFNQVLPRELEKRLSLQDAQLWYNDPLGLLPDNPIGTPGRDATVEAYKHVQRLLCITGACVCVFLIAFSFAIRNPALPDSQSIPLADEGMHDVELFPTPWSRKIPFSTDDERAIQKKWWCFWKR